jgi:Domain of unknown function (DUF4249)
MKKIILLFSVLFSFYFLSCDNSFSPYAPFTEDYILNGIMRGDTSYQVVTLSHSYQPNSSDPLTYKTDPAVVGAKIEITYDNKIYVLRDSSIARTDTSQFDTPFRFYYTDSLRPDINKTISIKATLPNGKILTAETKTPNAINNDYDFFLLISNFFFPPTNNRHVSIVYWPNIGNYIYAPDININYQVAGDSSLYKIALPITLTPTKNDSLFFDSSAVRIALDELANKYGSKSKLKIINITVDLLVFDEYLSTYYLSLQLGLDEFTVRIDNPDYSNIKGGYGIFGCYEKVTHTINFTGNYLHNLGFQ